FFVWILLFTIFDIFGFFNVSELAKYANNDVASVSYRIIQVTFQIVLTLFVFFACGWQSALASNIAWFFCVSDKLFYIFKLEPDYGGEYTWLEGWSIFAILKIFKVKAFTKEFNAVALLGVIIGILICVLL
ncbi:MAG: hypothetical protein ABIP51_19215, partial [Bacteroidia bacterium]